MDGVPLSEVARLLGNKPDMGYFSLRSIRVNASFCTMGENRGYKCSGPKEAKNADDRVYGPETMIEKPYICPLVGRQVRVQLKDYLPGSAGGRECGMGPHYAVEIKVNDATIHTFRPFGLNACQTPQIHLVELFDGVLRDCTIPDWASDNKPQCETQRGITAKINGIDEKLEMIVQ